MAKKKQDRPLKAHEIRSTEQQIRRYVKRDGGFRKGIDNKGKAEAKCLLELLGREKVAWDKSIDLNMVCTKSRVRAKKTKNSID